MSDNGGEKTSEELKSLEMRIVVEPNKPMVVHFPFLNDRVVTYGFLKIAEKVLDAHYKNQESKIISPPHGIMDFIRKKN